MLASSSSCLSSAIHRHQYHHQSRISSGSFASPSSSSSSSSSSSRQRRAPCRRRHAVTVKLEDGTGRVIEITEPEWTIGASATEASCKVDGGAGLVAPVHAKLTSKTTARGASTQVLLTALVGVDEGMLGDSRTWLDGQPLRPGVGYVIGSGQRVELGSRAASSSQPSAAFTVAFAEGSGRDPLVEMMMAGMAGSQGAKLKDALS